MSRRQTQPRIVPTHAAPAIGGHTPLAPGSHVGSYTIDRKLAEGGMAIVYEATHQVLPRRAAVKVMRDAAMGEQSRARLLREACLLADLRHRAIVDVHDAGLFEDGRAWLIMNLIEGTTLSDRLLVRGVLSPGEAAELVTHIASALSVAHHAGVVHRDLKPENLILVDDPVCPVRVIDWGIAQAAHAAEERLTIDGTITGTPHYMAPEQIRGEMVDGKCDVYSLGIVTYELLTGAPPFGGGVMEIVAHQLTTTPTSLHLRAPGVPAWLSALVMTMLAKDPEQRPTMAQVATAFAGLRPQVTYVAPPAMLDDPYEIVVELTADMEEDDNDRELDSIIAELPTRLDQTTAYPRLALGSNP